MVWALAGAALGGFLSSRQSKKQREHERASVSHNLNEQARFAREGGEKYGFSPLTLLQHGNPAGAGMLTGGSGPALASIDFLTQGLKDVGDIVSGDKARREAADELELELARLKLEEARAGIVAHRTNAVDMTGRGLSPLGRTNATYAPRAGATPARRFGIHENPIAPGREREIDPLINTPGVFELENEITAGPITLPGDSEPWGIDELATAVIVGGPQAVYNNAKDLPNQVSIREGSMADRIRDWWKDDKDENEKDKK